MIEPYKFPRPPTDQDFEALIDLLTKNRHPDSTVQRFGRNGQAQHGVDVLITRANGTADGYQCKHVRSLGEKTILAEAKNASGFPGGLSRFIIYTTAPRDTGDQLAARKATKIYPFLVVVSSWDDIAVDLMNDLGASQRYMAQLPLHSLSAEYMRQLRIAFDRPAFVDSAASEWSHQEQLQAVKDTQEFLTTGQLNTRDVRFVLRSLPASSVKGLKISEVRRLLRELRAEVTPAAKAELKNDYWEIANLQPRVETARIALMRGLNAALQANGVDTIDFDGM